MRQGHRFLPSIRLPQSAVQADSADNFAHARRWLQLSPDGWKLLRDNGLPICLRTNNIVDAFWQPRYRLPLVPDNIPASPLVWVLKDTGLDDERLVDCLGSPENWKIEGELWGRSLFMKSLQRQLPSPAYALLLENNEGAYEKLSRYTDADPHRRDAYGFQVRNWKPDAELQKLSLRLHARIEQLRAENPQSGPAEFLPEFWTRRVAQYRALYDAFDAQLSAGWKGKLYAVGYNGMGHAYRPQPAVDFEKLGYCPELNYYDAGSTEIYSAGTQLADFCSLDHAAVLNLIPAWEVARSRNPKAFRELSLYITDGAALAGAKAGRHEVITPARYEGWVQWTLWSIHDPGIPVILRHWCGYADKPSTPMFDRKHYQELDELGHPELKNAVSETYLKPIISAVDRVCIDQTLREFWLRGQPIIVPGLGHPARQMYSLVPYPLPGQPDNRWRLLECSANPPRDTWKIERGKATATIRVWAVATRLNDRVLLFAWSPCRLEGKITVSIPELGDVEVEAPQPWGYWVVKQGGVPHRLETK